jgi:hydrogenase maturation protease
VALARAARRLLDAHGWLAEAVELDGALGRLPPRLVVYGVEAKSVDAGDDAGPAIREAVEVAAQAFVGELDEPARAATEDAAPEASRGHGHGESAA